MRLDPNFKFVLPFLMMDSDANVRQSVRTLTVDDEHSICAATVFARE